MLVPKNTYTFVYTRTVDEHSAIYIDIYVYTFFICTDIYLYVCLYIHRCIYVYMYFLYDLYS